MKQERSIRAALILPLLFGLLIIAALMGAAVYYTTRQALVEQFDSALHARAQALATLVKDDEGRIEFDFADETMPAFSRQQAPEYFQIWLSDGTILEKSDSLGGTDLPFTTGMSGKANARDHVLPDGRSGRLLCLAFAPRIEDPLDKDTASREVPPSAAATVAVAQDRTPLDAVLHSLAIILLLSFLAMCGGSMALVLFSVRRGLRPVSILAEQVAAIGPANLDERFDPEAAPQELRPIHVRLNDLLGRLQSAFERERRFTRDVSHELRTPLTEMKTVLEVAQRWPDDAALQKSSFREAQTALDNMQQLIAKLLVLAKSEAGAVDVTRVPMNIGRLTRSVCGGLEGAARDRQVSVTITGAVDATVVADELLLSGVIRNLMENAIAYSSAGSNVTIDIKDVPDSVEWEILNTAPGLTTQDATAMFDPFWRKDLSRTDQSHNGLGLSILKSYCNLLSIRVKAVLSSHELLAICLSIPKTTAT